MRLLRLILPAVLVASMAASALADERLDLERRNALLKAEVSLASEPGVYFVVDMPARTIQVKARGAVLGEIPLSGLDSWGDVSAPGPYRLLAKKSFREPKRTKIEPGAEKDTTAIPDFFDVGDMPAHFRLGFSGGLDITVAPVGNSVASGTGAMARFLGWRAMRPLAALRSRIKCGAFTASLRATAPSESARKIYWVAIDNSPWIVRSP